IDLMPELHGEVRAKPPLCCQAPLLLSPSAAKMQRNCRWQARLNPMYAITVGGTRYSFTGLCDLMAKATPYRSGDALAGVAARSAVERVAAQMALADLPLAIFLTETVIPYEQD